jgi:hypothetical protein
MAKKPEDRYQTPAEGSAALERFQTPGGKAEAKANAVPAYKQWLETESQLETPRQMPPPPEPAAVKPGSGPMNPLQPAKPKPTPPAAPKPGTKPAAAAKPGTKTAPVPPPPVRVEPPPPAYPAPAYPPYPQAAPPYGAPPYPVPPGMGGPAPYPYPVPGQPTPPWQPPGQPAAKPMPLGDEVEVELVTMPPAPQPPGYPAAPPMPPPVPSKVVREPEERSLFDMSRRDLMMLVMGGGGVVAAVGFGYGLSRLVRALRPTADEPPTEEKKE